MKKLISLTLSLSLVAALAAGCGSQTQSPAPSTQAAVTTPSTPAGVEPKQDEKKTITFTDSAGRAVELPAKIDRIAPSGGLAQLILYTMAPEKMVGWSSTPSEKQLAYMTEGAKKLPEFGQFYGKNVSLNLEAIVKADPQVIIDLGDQKKSHKEDMNKIQEQTKIPTIFIKATLDTFPETYRTLGKLLGLEARGEELAKFAEETLNMAKEKSATLPADKRVTAYYGTGKTGLDGNAKGSLHEAVLKAVGVENALVVDKVSHKGGGNPIDWEQLLKLNPDYIFLESSAYTAAKDDPQWQKLRAVQEKHLYAVPNGPYGFFTSPPSVNMLAGIYYLGHVVYPETYNYNVVEKIQQFYKLFYHYDLSQKDAEKLLGLHS